MNKVISLREASRKLNLSTVTLQKRLDYNDYTCVDGMIDAIFIEQILEEKSNTVNIEKILEDLYHSIYKKKIDVRYRMKILTYASGFKYWGARYICHPIFQEVNYHAESIYIHKDDVDLIRDNVYEIIFMKFATDDEKFDYLINKTNLKNYERTSAHLTEFYEFTSNKKKRAVIEIGNYLRYFLKMEIDRFDDTEIKKFFKEVEKNLSGPAIDTFVMFYNHLKDNEDCKSNLIFRYNKHLNEPCNIIEPYDLDTYLGIAYMVLNESYWKEHAVLQKALKNELHAKTWLYHVMHFISSWRSVDITSKLPRFTISESPQKVLDNIRDNIYSSQYYVEIAETIFYQFQYGYDVYPSKTSKINEVQQLRITFSESIKPVLGMLALMCEAHNQLNNKTGSLCSMRNLDKERAIRLFGSPYDELLKGKRFSNRKANKNHLNMISEKGDKEHIDGYLLAAYARSHTGGLGRIPEVTSKYLIAKMDGYSADEIVMCLMERGVCSFIPYLLCSVLYKEDFKKKNIIEQTKDIKNLSITPQTIENILRIDEKLMIASNEKIEKIIKFGNRENLTEIISEIINSIIKGNCFGKDEGVYCLSKACSKGCVQKQRKNCFGCGYEMYTKSILIALSQEIFKKEYAMEHAVTEFDKIKWNSILENKLYPASHEILSTLKHVYKIDISNYKRILMGSEEYGFISKN